MKNFNYIIAAFFLLTSNTVSASDSEYAGVAYSCHSEVPVFSSHAIGYDHTSSPVQNQKGFFANATNLDEAKKSLEVTSCGFPNLEITLSRKYVNLPKPKGICGGIDWAIYKLHINGELAAEFYNGCGQFFLTVSKFNYKLCVGFDTSKMNCRTQRIDEIETIKASLFGEFNNE